MAFRLRIGHVFYFFFEKISINLPIKLSGIGQGSSKIVPRRLSSSNILFSLFAILIYILFCYISSCSILKVTLLECFSTVCYRRVASTTIFSCSNKILFSSSFSKTFCALSISPRRSLTNYSSTSIASMKSEYSASNSLIFLIVISFFLEASINSVLDRSVSSNLLL